MIMNLLTELKQRVEEILHSLPMEHPGDRTLMRPRVFLGAIPRRVDADAAFPCVVLRWMKGRDEEDGRTETVDLYLGVFAESGMDEAEQWTALLMGRLRRELVQQRRLGAWELELPVLSAKPDPEKQQEKYHLATISTQWRGFAPHEPVTEA